MSLDLTQFHAAFFEEALGCLDQAEDDLLKLEKGHADSATIDSAFRAIHSIKGSAASLGFEQMGSVAHEFETVLDELRAQGNSAKISDDHITVLLAGLDLLRTQIASAQLKQGDISDSRVQAINHKMRGVFEALANAQKPKQRTLHIQFQPSAQMLACGNDPLRYLDTLASLGTVTAQALWNESIPPDPYLFDECYLHWNITLATEHSAEKIAGVFEWVLDICNLTITETTQPGMSQQAGIALQPDVSLRAPADSEISTQRGARNIQVQSARIDDLLDQLGELAIFQSELEARIASQEMADLFQRLARQTSQMQDAILAMRMSPIATLFKRFDRVVRDAELQLGKKVSVQIIGQSNELDSSIIERLIDPVTHLIRNALDHGIETPSEREASGKTDMAQLILSAEQKSGSFVITIEDNGKGLDTSAIRTRAIEKGLATRDQEKTDSQWAQMIFSPGFSTANALSEWSGRGVGLDAVVTAIKQLGGQLYVHSHKGHGTRFSIALPLTLALTEALIVGIGQERFAITMNSVGQCLQLRASHFETLPNQQRLYRLRDTLLPFAHLSDLMQVSCDFPQDSGAAVVLTTGEQSCVLSVSKIIGQRQIVIKSVEKNLGTARYCQSATVLGDGKVIFVLNPSAVISDVGAASAIATAATTATEKFL